MGDLGATYDDHLQLIGKRVVDVRLATYDDHLRLIGKRVGNFLLVLIELFSLGVTAEALRAIIGSKSAISLQRGPVYPKFQVDRVPLTNHSNLLLRKLD